MQFSDVLKDIQNNTLNERFKGARFEVLIKYWLQTDPRYCDQLTNVWLWEDFPSRKNLGVKNPLLVLKWENIGPYNVNVTHLIRL